MMGAVLAVWRVIVDVATFWLKVGFQSLEPLLDLVCGLAATSLAGSSWHLY
jgi:hypothetical protein